MLQQSNISLKYLRFIKWFLPQHPKQGMIIALPSNFCLGIVCLGRCDCISCLLRYFLWHRSQVALALGSVPLQVGVSRFQGWRDTGQIWTNGFVNHSYTQCLEYSWIMSKHLWRNFLFHLSLLAQSRTLSAAAHVFFSSQILVLGLPSGVWRSDLRATFFPCGFFPRAWSGTIHSLFTSAIFCLRRHPHASVGPPVQISIQVWKVNHPIPSLDALLIFFKHLQQGTYDLLENRIWSICMCV